MSLWEVIQLNTLLLVCSPERTQRLRINMEPQSWGHIHINSIQKDHLELCLYKSLSIFPKQSLDSQTWLLELLLKEMHMSPWKVDWLNFSHVTRCGCRDTAHLIIWNISQPRPQRNEHVSIDMCSTGDTDVVSTAAQSMQMLAPLRFPAHYLRESMHHPCLWWSRLVFMLLCFNCVRIYAPPHPSCFPFYSEHCVYASSFYTAQTLSSIKKSRWSNSSKTSAVRVPE